MDGMLVDGRTGASAESAAAGLPPALWLCRGPTPRGAALPTRDPAGAAWHPPRERQRDAQSATLTKV